MTVKIHNCEQTSPEWFAIRKGKLSASHASAIGNDGAGLNTYAIEKTAELLSSGEPEYFENSHTRRGNELEPVAKVTYELEYKVEVTEIGFAEYNDYVGCSPDGLVGEDGLIEIKCPADKGYLYALLGSKIKQEYLWQMQMQMLILGKAWCDFVQFNPNFEKKILVTRVYPDAKMQNALRKGFISGEKQIKDIVQRVNDYN